jgi:polyisoprenoid-binding protein YceI
MTRFAFIPAALVLAAGVAVQARQAPPTTQAPPPQAAQPQRPAPAPLGPNQWRIDASHSAASFSVRHNVVSTVRGQLGPISGTIEYDGKDVRSVKADVAIDVTKINTQNQGRDAHLRRDDFFNTEEYPTMAFTSRRVEPVSDGKFRLIGDLTIRDKTSEVVLDVEGPSQIVTAKRGDRTTVLTGATATTKISRKAFGVLWNNMIEMMPVVGDEVTVTIDLELQRPTLPGATSGN